MWGIDHADAVEVMPAAEGAMYPAPRFFQGGNPRTGRKATVVLAEWLNMMMMEIMNVVAAAGIEPKKADNAQLLEALKKLIGSAEIDEDAVNELIEIYINNYFEENGGGAVGSDLVYPGAFADFFEQTPPAGWLPRNGAVVTNADTQYPDLWEALHKPENAWKCVTEQQWQDMSTAAPWNGIGGAPRFVVNTFAKTIRLPDTRGMYKEDSGFDGLAAGGVHGDAIRNITGSVRHDIGVGLIHNEGTTSGVFAPGTTAQQGPGGASGTNYDIVFDASRTVPTASVNRPKAFGVLGCVYVGKISS